MTTEETPSDRVSRITRHALIDHANELMDIDDPDVIPNGVQDGGVEFMLAFNKYKDQTLPELLTPTLDELDSLKTTVTALNGVPSCLNLFDVADDYKTTVSRLDDLAIILHIAATLGDVENIDNTRKNANKLRDLYNTHRFLEHHQAVKQANKSRTEMVTNAEITARKNLHEELKDFFAEDGPAEQIRTALTEPEPINTDH